MVRLLAIVLLCTLTASCASGPPMYASADVRANGLDDGGAVAGSIVFASDVQTWERYNSYRVWIDKVDGQKNSVFLTVFSDDPKVFEINSGGFLGNTFYAVLKPGEYQISEFTFFKNSGSGGQGIKVTLPEPIRFFVGRGETSYLGRFVAYGVRGRNFVGLPVAAGGYFEIADAYDEDLKLLGSKLSVSNTKHAVIAPATTLREYIRSASAK